MKIPFTVEQFFDVFGTYNLAIWPLQILAYILGILTVVLAFRENRISARLVCAILAASWIWMGVSYHIIHFSVINPVARIFGIVFVLQGSIFLLVGTLSGGLAFRFSLKPLPVIGACFIIYAMVVYPLLGLGFDHSYPRAPMFGVAPCPTTIFTFGILLWSKRPAPAYLLIVPFLWSVIGMSAAVSLRVPQDYGLFVAGLAGTVLMLAEHRKHKVPVLRV
jgi:hypothetical protein